ncbi:MAG: ATP-binding protein [Candidatus Hydrogenedentes bacterium]|nr:ATP-binding protein [Candidatus Hydrogenedentota bacterium]
MTRPYRISKQVNQGPFLNTRREDPDPTTPFKNNDQLLEAAYAVFKARRDLSGQGSMFTDAAPETGSKQTASLGKLERAWRQRFKATPDTVTLVKQCRDARLNRIETEIMMVLLLHAYGLWPQGITDISDVISALCLTPTHSLRALRALSETGTLIRKGIVVCDDPDEDLRDRNISISPDIAHNALLNHGPGRDQAAFRYEDELQPFLARLTGIMRKKSDALNGILRGYGAQQEFLKCRRKQDSLLHSLDQILERHPDWNLSRARKCFPENPHDWTVILALMGKALHHINTDDDLFSGAGLCRAICRMPELYHAMLDRLLSHAPLVRGGYIQPCGGNDNLFSENAGAVQGVEFELTAKSLQLLGIQQARAADKWDSSLRTPRLRLSDLALPESTYSAVRMALDHVRHAARLLDDWGLGEVFHYGRGATLLFYGPPGTGKTATAEAIASELGRPLLAADYSQIQNCFVGQTEKNIVKAFRKARQAEAVLFWDEADAMFYDRDSARYNWEVRNVNVLLQEIERFEGVCILATNRKTSLDKAFERRISAKVEFPRPDRALRERLWRKLLPGRLPLADDVSVARLSEMDLSGGEIKNVILNAARLACGRDEHGKVSVFDFERALAMETQDQQTCKTRIGFQRLG